MSRSDAYVRVSCDRRDDDEMAEEVELTSMAGHGSWDERNVDGELRRAGWSKDGEDDLCPNCTEEAGGRDGR